MKITGPFDVVFTAIASIRRTGDEIIKPTKEKIISKNVPFEVWTHIFETRIIDLKELYYKIFTEYDKKYFQLFDENISEEKFIINNIEKNKINKKIKIFN